MGDRAARVARILGDLRSALARQPADGIPFVPSDDHVGTVEVVLRPADLIAAGVRDTSVTVDGGSEGRYELTFRLARHERAVFPVGAPLAAVSRHQDRMEVWLLGRDDGVVRGNWFDDGRWQGWYRLDGAGCAPATGLTAVSRSPVRWGLGPALAGGDQAMEMWAVGRDGVVRGDWFDGRWNRWSRWRGPS